MKKTVILFDGTELEVEENGDNFIPDELDESVFENNLGTVTIADDNGSVVLHNQKVQFTKIGKKKGFVLSEKSREESERDILQAKIEELESNDVMNMMAMAEMYEENLTLRENNTVNMLAITELYELLLSGGE